MEQFILQRGTIITIIIKFYDYNYHADVALMICGDFNSEPDSAVYEFLSEGSIQADRPELESEGIMVLLLLLLLFLLL